MTTSNPNVPQPSGAAHPDGADQDDGIDPLLRQKLAGAVPDESLQDDNDDESSTADSVQDDRKRSGAG